MLSTSPSGALSPYYYKGGYLHGIHYGSFFDDMPALREMMQREEDFILRSPQSRRIMIDLYETRLTKPMLAQFVAHLERLRPRTAKLSIAAGGKTLRALRKALSKSAVLPMGGIYLCADMEEGKTWLVSEHWPTA